ncbi:MAG TPA: ABC transporter ATP-binding protein [Gammaproteobacteria bacterium]|nr:ABC transporter ATP-binding protein [Gammaproteobacteria bacterium]
MNIQAQQLSVQLGGRPVLKAVDLTLHSGELLGLIGPNGAGKTTLLKLLAGLIKSQSGSLQLDHQVLLAIPAHERAKRIAYLAQHSQVSWPLTVRRLVELGRIPHLDNWRKTTGLDRDIVQQVMEATDILALEHRRFDSLSGGERARVLLARALAGEPEILLADEPVAALDPSHQLEVMSLLQAHCRNGGAVIVVLHDLMLANHFCQRLQLLYQGSTLAEGPPGDVLTPDHLKQAYGLQVSDEARIDRCFLLPWKMK